MKPEKMYVWDDEKDIVKRYVIHINPDGSCLAIAVHNETYYETNGNIYNLVHYAHCSPIEKEYMTQQEAMGFVLDHLTEILVKSKNGNAWDFAVNWDFANPKNLHFIYRNAPDTVLEFTKDLLK